MKKVNAKKLFLNKTTVATLSRDAMKVVVGGQEACAEDSFDVPVDENEAFLSIATCTHENGSHCKHCDSCCKNTKCSK